MTVAASFAGAVVLLTGVGRSGQVGEVVPRAFGERGAHVALVDRDGAAAKAGVITLMQSVAAEERPHDVRADAIAPTAIRTAANVREMGESANYVERETVADWVVWLCSSESGPITGQVFRLG